MNRQQVRVTHQVASWCLSYPDEVLLARLTMLRLAATDLPNGSARRGLIGFLDHAERTPLDELQQHYVAVFDLNRRHALHLSYWTDGDTRRRGEVLLAFKARYRACGFLVNMRGELPDHLPLVLEYAAVADPDDGPNLLQEYRPSLELLRLALVEDEPIYAGVVAAVCETLPGESPADRLTAHRMAAVGPPREEVGLDAYDPRLLPLADAASAGFGEER